MKIPEVSYSNTRNRIKSVQVLNELMNLESACIFSPLFLKLLLTGVKMSLGIKFSY